MDKATLLSQMTASGEIQTHSHTKNWDEAFKLYNAANHEKASPKCGSCYNKVKKWLQS